MLGHNIPTRFHSVASLAMISFLTFGSLALFLGRLVQAFPYCMIEHLRGKKDKSMRSKLERLIGPKGELACGWAKRRFVFLMEASWCLDVF